MVDDAREARLKRHEITLKGTLNLHKFEVFLKQFVIMKFSTLRRCISVSIWEINKRLHFCLSENH